MPKHEMTKRIPGQDTARYETGVGNPRNIVTESGIEIIYVVEKNRWAVPGHKKLVGPTEALRYAKVLEKKYGHNINAA